MYNEDDFTRAFIDEETRNKRNSYAPAPTQLSVELAKKALNLLNIKLSFEKTNELIQYMQDSFFKFHCVVLYQAGNSDCKEFLDKIGVDLNGQELIITDGYGILYSSNYKIAPKPVKMI